jgi:hypothetical protein
LQVEIKLIIINPKYLKMKKQISFFMTIAMVVLTLGAFAQKPFAGTITFEKTATGTTNPNIAAALAEQTVVYTVMGNNYRVDANVGIDISVISNGTAKTVTTVFSIPGYGKYYMKQTGEKIAEAMSKIKQEFEYKDDTKTICGYNCKKVIVKVTDLETDEEDSAVLWVTSELGLGDDINFAEYPGLKGYPLCTEATTEIEGEEVTVITTATQVTPSKKVKATEFLLPSDAKDFKDAPEDLKQMLGMSDDEE